MKTKTTLILLALAVAGGLYIKFYESKGPNTEEARRQAQNVINFDRQKVDGIVIQNGDDKTELRRQENKWRLEAPIKDQADRTPGEGGRPVNGGRTQDLPELQPPVWIPACAGMTGACMGGIMERDALFDPAVH